MTVPPLDAIDADSARADAFARNWPGLGALDDALRACTGETARDADCLAPLLIETAWLDAGLATLIAPLRHAPLMQPPLRGSGGSDGRLGLLLARNRHATMTLTVQPPRGDPPLIVASGRRSLTRCLRDGGAVLERWRCRPGHAVRTESVPLCPATMVDIDGAGEAARAVRQTGVLVMLTATFSPAADAAVVRYDAGTGRSIGRAAADEAGPRVQMLLALLGASADPHAQDAFTAATVDPDPTTRWAAMRGWLLQDASAARPRLAAMAVSDPAIDVRVAARATLARLDARLAA